MTKSIAVKLIKSVQIDENHIKSFWSGDEEGLQVALDFFRSLSPYHYAEDEEPKWFWLFLKTIAEQLVSDDDLEYLGSSLMRQHQCNSLTVWDTDENEYKRTAKPSETKMFSLAGLELLLLAPDWLQLLVVGAVGGVAIGWLSIALEKAVQGYRSAYRARAHTKLPIYCLFIEEQRVKGIEDVVFVDLESCLIFECSEGAQHDFKAELAAAKGRSKLEVDAILLILDSKVKIASYLFKQLGNQINQSSNKVLQFTNPTASDAIRFIDEIAKAYSLTVRGYELLLEVVEQYWAYCPIKMRQEFVLKAQAIIEKKLQKAELELSPEEKKNGVLFKVEAELASGEIKNSELLLNEPFEEDAFNTLLLNTIKSHNDYVRLAHRFAYSVFGAAARDKDREDIGGIDETDYLFNLSEKNAIILKSALQEIEEGKGRAMTLDELREELGFEEEEE